MKKNQQTDHGLPPILSVGEVAQRSAVPVSTLHFYESKGLITSQRSAGNQRRYPPDVLRRIAFIRAAQQVGIGLGDIAAGLDRLPERRTPSKSDWEKLSALWRADLDARITHLQQLRDTLDHCIGCGCLSLESCQLRNLGDQLSAQGP